MLDRYLRTLYNELESGQHITLFWELCWSVVGKIAVALVNQGLPDISVKLLKPKAFYGDHRKARAWLNAIDRYLTIMGLDKDK